MVLLRNFLEQTQNPFTNIKQMKCAKFVNQFHKGKTWAHSGVFSSFPDEMAKYAHFITKKYKYITFCQ
jgi:hypothetical protein